MSESHSWMNYVFFGFPSTHVHTCPDSFHINQFYASTRCQLKSPSLQSIRLSTSTNPRILNRATLLIWLGRQEKNQRPYTEGSPLIVPLTMLTCCRLFARSIKIQKINVINETGTSSLLKKTYRNYQLSTNFLLVTRFALPTIEPWQLNAAKSTLKLVPWLVVTTEKGI